jgi:ligand-binding sensor domain-containing protein/two-component sensor histidine kinase
MAYGPETKYLSGFNYKVYQSNTGYLWVCTMNGVVRFDGKRYNNFFSDYLNPNSPTDNIVSDVTEDKNGHLWIAGFSKGASRYNQRTGSFRKYPVLSSDNNPIYGINKIINDYQYDLWFATAGRGLARYNFVKDTFDFFYQEPLSATDGTQRGYNYTTDIIQDPYNTDQLWVATFHGLFLFNKPTGKFTHFPCIDTDPAKDILINDLELHQNGILWMGTWGEGIKSFDIRKKKFTQKIFPGFSNIVYDIKAVNDSVLYAACLGKGLFAYNINTNTASDITPVDNAALALTKRTEIQKISVTAGGGIFASGQFYLYQQHPFYTRLKKNIVFNDDDKQLRNLNGIVWDKKNQQYWFNSHDAIYSMPAELSPVKIYITKLSKAPYNLIYTIAVDKNTSVWATTSLDGLLKYNKEKNGFYKPEAGIPLPDSVLNTIRKINTDKEGNLWLYGNKVIRYFDVVQNKTKSFPIQWDNTYNGQKNVVGGELLVSPAGEAWLLTQQGIFIYNKNGFVKQVYKTGSTQDDMAQQMVMVGAFSEKYKVFWFSSGDGLQVMNYETHTVLANHTIADGLPSMLIRGIVIDSLNRVWVATSAGLGYFDPLKKIWQTFNRFDGLETDFLDGGIYYTGNNMLAIAQSGGFSLYKPENILIAEDTPYLRITSIQVNNQAYTDTVLPEFVKQVELPYNKNNIIIEYAAMDWVYPAKTNYRYRIEGIAGQDTWIPNDEARLNLAGLQPGKYTLHLRALGSGGAWSNEVVLPILIHPPFWRTVWFIGLVSLLIFFSGWKLFQYRIAQVKKLERMRNNISQNLHDDIGASLSNIGILNELARRNMNEQKDKATEYLDRAAEDIQHISETLGDIVWNINPMFDNINNLFIRMKRYAADMAEGKNIHCVFEMPEDADLNLPMDKRRDFYLLYKEAINNMVKHSSAQHAWISIRLSASQLNLLIKDDGKGFDESLLKEGNGLSNMRQRAQQLNGKLKIDSLPGNGTALEFSMPV